VRQHERVVVDVDDPRLGGHPLRHLVRVVGGGQPGADVQELPHPLVEGQVLDRPRQEAAARARLVQLRRVELEELVARLPVGPEVVLTTQPVVPDACRVRDHHVDVAQDLAAVVRPVRHEHLPPV
jgi:hypothetical protein